MPLETNIATLMQERLPPPLLAALRAAGEVGEPHGFRVFLVGGMVRDLLAERPPGDPDLMVQGPTLSMNAAAAFAVVLASALDGSIGRPSLFGTIKLEVDDLAVDVATARTETYAHPGALPTVSPAPVEADLARRDFTVNAIAVDLAPARFGRTLDPHGGFGDLRRGALAVLHDGSFADDPTRAFRAARYEARLGLRMTPATEAALRRDIGHVDALSGDRVRHEMERVFAEREPETALARADELGLLEAAMPGLSWSAALSDAAPAVREAEPSLRTAGPTGCLALLASPLSHDDAEQLIERLNAPRPWAKVIEDTALVWEQLPYIAPAGVAPSVVYDMLEGASPEAVLAWAALSKGAVAARLRDYYDNLRHVQPFLGGDDLLSLGVPQGPLVGELLRELLNARLDGLAATREDEEALVLRRLSSRVE
ncbi:MAG: hypothetical protein OXC99_06425 [Chloroflexi bacterium]|nr:hypothetical protein [Chloroflexota bacterium]